MESVQSAGNCVGQLTDSKKGGLDYPKNCVLCDQEDETVQHILSNCIFTSQFWYNILTPTGLSTVAP